MLTNKRHRLITAALALFSLLYMQVAVASYACPAEGKAVEMAAMAEAGMPCAGAMVQDIEHRAYVMPIARRPSNRLRR